MARMTLQKMIEQERDSCPMLCYQEQIKDPTKILGITLEAELAANMDEKNSLAKRWKRNNIYNIDFVLGFGLGIGLCAIMSLNKSVFHINPAIVNSCMGVYCIALPAYVLGTFERKTEAKIAYNRGVRRNAEKK